MTIDPLGRGRPHQEKTGLGQKMRLQGYRCYDISYLAQISPRTLTEILAGRKNMTSRQRAVLSNLLKCEPQELD